MAWAQHTITLPKLPSTGFGVPASADKGPPPVLNDKLVRGLNACDARALTELVDLKGLETRMFPQLGSRPRASGYVDERLLGDIVRATFEAYCAGASGAHSIAKIVELHVHAGQSHIRIRLDQGALGFTYLEFIGEKVPSGGVRVIQWLELNEGRMASETLTAIVRLAVGPDSGNFAMVDKISEIEVLRAGGHYAQSLEAMGYLSQEAAESLAILKMRAEDARRINHMSEYNRALDLIDLKYGHDWTLALLLADNYIDKGELDKALRGVDALESRIGVDAGTCLMRARMFAEAQRYDESLTYARKAVDLEPDLRSAWFALAKGYVLQNDYSHAVATYQTMQTRFHTSFKRETLASDPDLAGFAQSDAVDQWLSH
jgi:hypothetical protein